MKIFIISRNDREGDTHVWDRICYSMDEAKAHAQAAIIAEYIDYFAGYTPDEEEVEKSGKPLTWSEPQATSGYVTCNDPLHGETITIWPRDLGGHVENAIAISADLHTNQLYDAFYARMCDRLGGFTGIYDLVQSMALIVSAYEVKNGGCPQCWEEAYMDWVEVTGMFVERVMKHAIEHGELPDLQAIFNHIIS